MKFVYVDESGDFGLSDRSSKSVVIAASFTDSDKKLSTWLKRMRKRKLNKTLRKKSELKASDATDQFLEYLYRHANLDLDFSVYAVVIDKTKIPERLVKEEGIVYLEAIKNLIEISKPDQTESMFWYFDRRTVKKLSWALLRQEIRAELILASNSSHPLIEVHPADSNRLLNLQFADFIAYALGRYLNQDRRWFKLIQPHIKKVHTLAFKNKK